jgi:hypothetical protein
MENMHRYHLSSILHYDYLLFHRMQIDCLLPPTSAVILYYIIELHIGNERHCYLDT